MTSHQGKRAAVRAPAWPGRFAARSRTPRRGIGLPAIRQRVAASLFFCCLVFACHAAAAQTADHALRTDKRSVVDPDSVLSALNAADSLDVAARFLRAQILERLGSYGKAARDYERVLEQEPGHIEAQLGLQRVRGPILRLSERQFELLRNRVDTAPDDASLRFQFAEALMARGDLEAAITEFRAYLERATPTPDAVETILVAIAGSGKHPGLGRQIAERYVEAFPHDDDLRARLGYFMLWQGNLEAAVSTFRAADSLGGGNQLAREGLSIADSLRARAAHVRNRYDELRRTVERHPDRLDARMMLAEALIGEGRYFDAHRHLELISDSASVRSALRRSADRMLAAFDAHSKAAPASVLDRIYLQVLAEPDNRDRRFELVQRLIDGKRYYEAYDLLAAVRETDSASERWQDLFVLADSGLVRTRGLSPLYAVDRLRSLLIVRPLDLTVRYELVDALIGTNRFEEAADLLLTTPNISDDDAGYRGRLLSVARGRGAFAAGRVALADSLLASGEELPDELNKSLAAYLVIVGQTDRALRHLTDLVAARPEDVDLKLDQIDLLRSSGALDRARDAVDTLMRTTSDDIRVRRAFVLSRIPSTLDREEMRLLEGLYADTSRAGRRFLLDAAEALVDAGRIGLADSVLAQVNPGGDRRLQGAAEGIAARIAGEIRWTRQAYEQKLLERAQRLARANNLKASEAAFGEFLDSARVVLRDEYRQLASVLEADSNFVGALAILDSLNAHVARESLPDRIDTYNLQKELARVRAEAGDSQGAVELLDELTSFNPRDYEAGFLKAQVERETGDFETALTPYDRALSLARGSDWLTQTRESIDADFRYNLLESGEWNGYDFSGILVPVAGTVHAEGGDTFYERDTRGFRAEVTLPVGAVLTAGFESHFVSGTRRLIPSAEETHSRINQVYGGVYLDLTPRIRSEKAPYTNRLFTEVGLFDYEGRRNVGYFDLRYWRQEPGRYTAEAGLRSTEGSLDLWSPGGGEFNLRLTQFSARAQAMPFEPDSLLRVAGSVVIDAVSDNYGILSGGSDQNIGSTIMLEAGYRVLSHTYLGLVHHRLDFQSRTDLYFSPEHYETTELFLEYEHEVPTRWYLRARGAVGAIARSSGALMKRFELDLVRRLSDKLSLTIASSFGEAARSFGGGDTSMYSRYGTFLISGRIYWTL